MELTPAPKTPEKSENPARDTSGIALFMVIGAMSVLSILVTEFAYIAQINQKMAYDNLDSLKAHYLAKSGFKLSLLRLKAYDQVKSMVGKGGPAGAVPKQLLEKIWSFPFFYPIPTNIPGLSPADKEQIEKFQKESNLEGSFQAVIESESSKYNLNSILPQFAAPAPSPTASPSPNPNGSPTPTGSPSPTPFNAEEARESLRAYLDQMLSQKIEADPEFAEEQRDFNNNDFMDNLFGWADRTYESKAPSSGETKLKRAPFFSLAELHMIEPMNDDIYNLFAPSLTTSATAGININTMTEQTLKALAPMMTKEEVEDFFKFRDSEEQDNTFNSSDDFFKYLLKGISAWRNDSSELDRFKADLAKRNINIVTDETDFKISVQAQVNQSVRLIQAWVSLTGTQTPTPPPALTQPQVPGSGTPQQTTRDAGLRITFMRVL